MSNTQHKIDKARPPRVQISYDVEIGGAETQKELPLVVGVVGDFSPDETEFRERRFVNIDKDNFNEVMHGMNPNIEILVDNELVNNGDSGDKLAVTLNFSAMDDFSPDSVAMQVEPLKKLLELREELSELRNRTASNDRLKEQLAELLENRRASVAAPVTTASEDTE